jgi:PEGA domain-containing protein
MSRCRRQFGTLVAGLTLLASTPSRAGDAPPDVQAHAAATHFDRGVKLYEERDWRAALVEFQRAYAISPQYRVLYNVGQCLYQVEDYVGSLEAFEKYIAEGGAEIPQERREQVQSSIHELRGRVAHLRVVANVAGAEVTVDDAVAGTTPLAAPLLVSAGRRKIVARKPGRTEVVRFVDVAGEDSVDVALTLEAAPPTGSTSPSGNPEGGRSPVPAIVAFSIAAAGGAVGAVSGIEALGNKWDLDRACSAKACPPSSQSLIDESKRNAALSSVGFAVGAAGLGAGILVLLMPASAAVERSTGRSLAIRPFVGLGSAGATGVF